MTRAPRKARRDRRLPPLDDSMPPCGCKHTCVSLYFIQATPSGYVKIGITNDIGQRLRDLQRANAEKLVVLATTLATRADEQRLHAMLKEWRMEGEWFRPDRWLEHALERLRAGDDFGSMYNILNVVLL